MGFPEASLRIFTRSLAKPVFKRLFIDTDRIDGYRYNQVITVGSRSHMFKYDESNQQPVQLLTRHELCDRWRVSGETLKRRERAGALCP